MKINKIFKSLNDEMNGKTNDIENAATIMVVMPSEENEIIIYANTKATVKDLRRALENLSHVSEDDMENVEQEFASDAKRDLFKTIDEASLPDDVKAKVKKMTADLFASI